MQRPVGAQSPTSLQYCSVLPQGSLSSSLHGVMPVHSSVVQKNPFKQPRSSLHLPISRQIPPAASEHC
jgi:hypothetical protein